ncbi:hypothetical protein K470DRAFT_163450 [Piedraia hortae CBS 480.64]|uniref:Uncharacterized protein n=1 Tax=Piedraia hortae CBS 480.64 TaxID=1314780 RepID=A0A6A7C6G7_9PEZI|nr:hypothetical protein K470DRAFT_163450 [Piedraia hortae CBS 480.64]
MTRAGRKVPENCRGPMIQKQLCPNHEHPVFITTIVISSTQDLFRNTAKTRCRIGWEQGSYFINTIEDSSSLQNLLTTLKLTRHCMGSLPSSTMRYNPICLDFNKLPTSTSTGGKIYFFDSHDIFETILSPEELGMKMHKGFGHVVDQAVQPWQDTMRSSEGQPILPSNFLKYPCNSTGCACRGNSLAELHSPSAQTSLTAPRRRVIHWPPSFSSTLPAFFCDRRSIRRASCR